MDPELHDRLRQLKAEADDHSRVAGAHGVDIERPLRSLEDGYPENAVLWVGKTTERLLKSLWRHYGVAGDPPGTLGELIRGCTAHLAGPMVQEALRDIQRLRNRHAHDVGDVAEEDGLLAVRRLLDVLLWLTWTGGPLMTAGLTPRAARRAEFLAGLYVTMGFHPVERRALSEHAVYQVFARPAGPDGSGARQVELLSAPDLGELRRVARSSGGARPRSPSPGVTRYAIVDEQTGEAPDGYRVVAHDRLMDIVVDLEAHLTAVAAAYPLLGAIPSRERLVVGADLLVPGPADAGRSADAMDLLRDVTATGGHVVVVGRSGSGKSTLLKRLVTTGTDLPRYRFYFDLSLRRAAESVGDLITRTLAPVMTVDRSQVLDVFSYFARIGAVVCVFDGLDEAAPDRTLRGFLRLLGELGEIISTESVVVMAARASYLADSPEVRRMLSGDSPPADQTAWRLHAQGVDAPTIRRSAVVRLRDTAAPGGPTGASPLECRLAAMLGRSAPLPELLWSHLRRLVAMAGLGARMPQLVDYFGAAALRGRFTLTLPEIWDALGPDWFAGGRPGFVTFVLAPLFRPAGDDWIAPVHSAYQELLAAEYIRSHRDAIEPLPSEPLPSEPLTSEGLPSEPSLSEQIRAFLRHRSRADEPAGDCVLPAGGYVVGPDHHLMLRRVERPVRFDRYAVSVRRYREFLAAAQAGGCARWDHPDTPAGHTHQPSGCVPGYYEDAAYDDHPAVGVDWWSAYAFARYDGKRLPTSLEWEAAARGADGRLFPWGDELDPAIVNCAGSWPDLPRAVPVTAHPGNRSPFGLRQMAGNVWELTSTFIEESGHVVMCGGSHENPGDAVRASSKSLRRRGQAGGAVGFRCVADLG